MDSRGAIALVLQVGFLSIALIGRMALHRRRTGDWGFRWQRYDRVARISGALFAGAMTIGTVGAALAATSVVPVIARLDSAAVAVVGVVVFTVGVAVTLAAQSAMGASWRVGVRPDERTELVVDGPFRWARNPVFTGMITTATGLALIAPTWLTITAVVLLIGAVELQVRFVEEPHLQAAMPEWSRYAQRVGRFVPHLGRFTT